MIGKKEEVKEEREKMRTRPNRKKERPAEPVERTEKELVDLTSQMYKLVVERGGDGVLQSEIWKELGLTSRDGSRLAIRLERRGLIGRAKALQEGRWTYKLTPLRFPTDLVSVENAPCMACPYEPRCSMGEGDQSPDLPLDRTLGDPGVSRGPVAESPGGGLSRQLGPPRQVEPCRANGLPWVAGAPEVSRQRHRGCESVEGDHKARMQSLLLPRFGHAPFLRGYADSTPNEAEFGHLVSEDLVSPIILRDEDIPGAALAQGSE